MPTWKTSAIAIMVIAVAVVANVQACSGQTMFAVVLGSQNVNQSGWLSGYVVYGQSGNYTLAISASGSKSIFPITDARVIVLVSDEAAAGGIQSLKVDGVPIFGFTRGVPDYYDANGGPLSQPDYYGYNDSYVIPQITYSQGHYPDNAKDVTVSLQFSRSATSESKVMFLCYGITAQCKPLETSFSDSTLFVTPEYAVSGLFAFGACFGAFVFYKKICQKDVS